MGMATQYASPASWQYLRIYSPGGTCSGMLAITSATSWFWPCGVRVTCDVEYLCVNFSLPVPRPLSSRVRPDVRDRRQTKASALWGRRLLSDMCTGMPLWLSWWCYFWFSFTFFKNLFKHSVLSFNRIHAKILDRSARWHVTWTLTIWQQHGPSYTMLMQWLQLRFDARSTVYQRSLSALWRNPL